MSTFKDLTGKRFGMLIAIERVGTRNTFSLWRCKCDCGNETDVKSASLINGHTKSCGCFNSQLSKERLTTHGMRKTKIYGVWSAMKRRCANKNTKAYHNYGGRGITVCDEWQEFTSFYNWVKVSGYNDTLTIDRIDNEKEYSPSNCRWVSRKVQANNTRVNVWYEYNGQKKTLSQWSDVCGISYGTLESRLHKCRWSFKKSLETPIRIQKLRNIGRGIVK